MSRPLYAAVVRVAARSDRRARVRDLLRGMIAGLGTVGDPGGNELFPLDNDDYDDADHEADFLARRSRRSGMLLNLDELVGVVHLPSSSVSVPKFRQTLRRSRAAPAMLHGSGVVLGVNEHAGESRPVTLHAEQRARHMHVIGTSGTGKSTLLLNLIRQDLERGDGLMLLDPHGDLIDAVLDLIPPTRLDDVVLVDPGDEAFPIGFNVLSAHSALEKNLLASDLVAVFRRLSTSWGDQMNSVLGNAILAFLERSAGGTLADLRRFLVEPGFRRQILSGVTDPEIVYYWNKEFPLLTGRPQGPVLTRLDAFLRPRPLRNMVTQRESRLDFGQIMDSGKILLARLSHGAIGAENAYLLGTLLLSKVHQLALGRQRQREQERRYFWLYVDEFHHFAIPSMASVLSGIRKYRLGLVLAHQELQQLEHVGDVANALLSNAFTRVCFRLGDQDAKRLEGGFANFSASDLLNLRVGEAICRVERAESDFTLRTQPIGATQTSSLREEAIHRSRERYATPRTAVEAALAEARDAGPESAEPSPPRTRTSRAKEARTPSTVPVAPGIPPEAMERSVPSPAPGAASAPTPPSAKAEAAPSAPAPAERPVDSRPVSAERKLGRGGAEHQDLQMRIKGWAQRLGWRATIEGEALGSRAADVALERSGVSVAVEICRTTTFVHELGNVRKCLDAGFDYVVATSVSAERLARLREVVEGQLTDAELERVRFLETEKIEAFVSELEIPQAEQESLVCGYRVTTRFAASGATPGARKTVNEVISRSLKRLQTRRSGPGTATDLTAAT
ncbi:MAG: type IV secretion system DNA-binding domain-containing protein [Tepidisphaeraceae bacterium]